MVTLFFFGPEVVAYVGARTFMWLYTCSGVAGNLAHCFTSRHPRAAALGASGGVNSVVVYSTILNPWRMIIMFAEFIPLPMPAVVWGGAFVGKDVAAMMGMSLPWPFNRERNVGHAAHVAGAACGALFWFLSRGRLGYR